VLAVDVFSLIVLCLGICGVGAVVCAVTGPMLRQRTAWIAVVTSLSALACVGGIAAQHVPGAQLTVAVPWVPTLGMELRFLVDGLSIFYAFVVSGMGVLVMLYGRGYMGVDAKDHGKFYAYLLLFMGAMLGTVMAGDLLLLFVFWEFTGLMSFLLIGFEHTKEKSRTGARMALLVTSSTALVMLLGIALCKLTWNTLDLKTLLHTPPKDGGGMSSLVFVLLLVGAMGKSAQFPFHFWLPNAMAAPTPVSAYLHSATMVKLGVFFVARVFPCFSQLPEWSPLLMAVGLGTALLAAVLALLSHDLKAILAQSTVLQLGLLIAFYGLGTTVVKGDVLHVANHVFYKGALFMIAGLVDHAVHGRDIREIGGLIRRIPWVGVSAFIVAASMAGMPLTLGFVSKEYFLKDLIRMAEYKGWAFGSVAAVVVFVMVAVLKVAFAVRFWCKLFLGKETTRVREHWHKPDVRMVWSILLLAAASFVFGVWPQGIARLQEWLQVPGMHAMKTVHFALWQGLTWELFISIGVMIAGALLAAILWRVWSHLEVPPVLRWDTGFERFVAWLPRFAVQVTRLVQAERPLAYLPWMLMFIFGTVGTPLAVWWMQYWDKVPFSFRVDGLRCVFALSAVASALAVIVLRTWMAQLVAMSVLGFLVTFYFVLMQAPDLALTQILIETITLVLILLLFARFPHKAEEGEVERKVDRQLKAFRVALAVGIGALTSGLAFMALAQKEENCVGLLYPVITLKEAQGANAVNTILVDFRGWDTILEVAVLVIALLGALGLVTRVKNRPAGSPEARR